MPEVIARKVGTHTFTVLAEFIDDIDYIRLGDQVKIKITKSRNLKFLSKYWVMVGALLNIEAIQEEYKNKERVSDQLKIDAGFCYIKQHELEGIRVITKTPMSISIDSMDEGEFNKFYDAVMYVVLMKWMEKYLPPQLVDQYAEYFATNY